MTRTLFIDIDGTLIPQHKPVAQQHVDRDYPVEALPGVVKKFQEWESKGYRIILTTGRREAWRKFTEDQLLKMGIWYDQLIMGAGSSQRVLINDLKPHSDGETAIAINIPRNKGVGDLEI